MTHKCSTVLNNVFGILSRKEWKQEIT